jgi:hypothetical protein
MTHTQRTTHALMFSAALVAACSDTLAPTPEAPVTGGPGAGASAVLPVANRSFDVIAVDRARLPLSAW